MKVRDLWELCFAMVMAGCIFTGFAIHTLMGTWPNYFAQWGMGFLTLGAILQAHTLYSNAVH